MLMDTRWHTGNSPQ